MCKDARNAVVHLVMPLPVVRVSLLRIVRRVRDMAIPRSPAPPRANAEGYHSFAEAADSFLNALLKDYKRYSSCEWCKSENASFDKSNCCTNCGGPR